MTATWQLPDPPSDDVEHVTDREGVRWEHQGDFWEGRLPHGLACLEWGELLMRGPLTAVDPTHCPDFPECREERQVRDLLASVKAGEPVGRWVSGCAACEALADKAVA